MTLGVAALMTLAAACTSKQNAGSQAEAQADSTIRINCMICVTPDVRDSVVLLSKELVEASQQDEGMIEYDLLESATDESSLMIYETWQGQDQLDKHSASEHFTRIVPELQRLASTMDVQVLKAGQKADVLAALRLNCPMKVAAENRDAVIALGKELVAGSQQDEGNISYDLFLSTTDSTRMLIFETWADQPSLDKHSAAEHFTRIVPQLKEKSEMGVVTFEMAAPGTAE